VGGWDILDLVTSVIVPAHNEASVVGRALDSLLREAEPDEFDIIVVCNGCTDDTATVARTRVGVQVVEIQTASKVAALNAGDGHAQSFPRIYLDADIELSTASLRLVRDALADNPAAAPLPIIDSSAANALVRAYFAIWSRLGYSTRSVLGSGVYGLSKTGRARWDQFPDLISDDGFVYRHFTADERINPAGATFVIRTPRTLRALIRRRIRIVAGNIELTQRTGLQAQYQPPGAGDVIRSDPRLLVALPVFVLVNAYSSAKARRRAKDGTQGSWGRDATARESA
jgi:glycosyltransferase involved in cell wall biosynthesis